MKCPKCQSENPKYMKFCGQCNAKLGEICPKCNSLNPVHFKFCFECGNDLAELVETERPASKLEGERKYVTVLFSDLSGYTAMCEQLDPEEVKEIMNRIFGNVAQVVTKYEGFIEKFIGDAVMALFGVPKSHEDDPVRAVRAAREIHELVEAMSPKLKDRIGKPLSMHTGINTGLVVTGEIDLDEGTHGVAGDTVNLTARLCSLAKAGEILVGANAYHQSLRSFTFEELEPTKAKGKTKPIRIYKVLSPKDEPRKIHRIHGFRAELIGRKLEMARLREAVNKLRNGEGSIFSISGNAGTGKSRLVEEFKASLDLKKIQWREGHAFAYAQNIPYFPLMDLMNRTWQIDEGDPQEMVKEKIESSVEDLIGKKDHIIPYIGNLYALSYPETEGVDPQFWKIRLYQAILEILSALAQKAPTIVCLEDLHWADPSSLDLLRFLLSEFNHPALFVLVYRPYFTIFTSDKLSTLEKSYKEIRLHDLSASEAQDMTQSLLKTKNIPTELQRFVEDRVEGNPFYLEEVINSLIESEMLIRDKGTWKLTISITESGISPTIHGVISGRLDRLGKEAKRILQEASVIGRTFLYEILKRVTGLKEQIDSCLSGLEWLDLIRTKSLQPEMEYIFKHALTQEVVYNGLLKKERRILHERIGLVMEQLFQDRISEFYEALAFHFKQSFSILKAVYYLMKSGEKNLNRYSLEESHQYFKEAYSLLTQMPGKTKEDQKLLIDLIINWGMVFHHRGDFKGMEELFRSHEEIAVSLNDDIRLGEYYMWLGQALHLRLKTKESYRYLTMAFKLGNEINGIRVMGWASAYLISVCGFLGFTDEGFYYEKKAIEISKKLVSEHFLYIQAMASAGYAYWSRGEKNKAFETGKALVEFGKINNNIRGLAIGNLNVGHSYLISGDYALAIESYKSAIDISADPFHSKLSETMLGICYLMNGQFHNANKIFPKILRFSQKFGAESMEIPARMFLGVVFISQGQMTRGFKMIKIARQYFHENDLIYFQALSEYILGKVYLQIVEGSTRFSLLTMIKNIFFIAKQVPFSYRKGELHFKKAIELGYKIGAKGIVGQAYLDLGILEKLKNKPTTARIYLQEAIEIFKQSDAESFLAQAKKTLLSL